MMYFCETQPGDLGNLETLRAVLRTALESTVDGVLVTGAEGGILAFSARFAEMWRVPASLVENSDIAGIRAHLESQCRTPCDLVKRLGHPADGGPSTGLATRVDGRQFEFQTTPETFEMSGVRTWIFRDVSNRVDTERALEECERRYQTLFHESHDAILLIAFDGSILDANRAAFDVCGRPRAELLATSFQALCSESDALVSRIHDRGEVRDYDVQIRRADGSIRACVINAVRYAA